MMDVGKCRISRKYILKGARACCALCNLKCRVEVAGVSHVEHPRARSCWLLVTQINLEGGFQKKSQGKQLFLLYLVSSEEDHLRLWHLVQLGCRGSAVVVVGSASSSLNLPTPPTSCDPI